ncbi:MAG: hypothetical protein J5808_06965 [Paludibacteraceae bacterium]|nr:hypothetical protein [Paludibacteraceae bacterium]
MKLNISSVVRFLTLSVMLVSASHIAVAGEVISEIRYWVKSDTVQAYVVISVPDGQSVEAGHLASLQDEIFCLSAKDYANYMQKADRSLLKKLTPKDIDGFVLQVDEEMSFEFVSAKYEAYNRQTGKYKPAKRQFLVRVLNDDYSLFMVHHSRDGKSRVEMAYSKKSAPLSVKSIRGLEIAQEFAECPEVMQREQNGDYREDDSMHLERRSIETIQQIGKSVAVVDYLSNCR